MSACLQRFVRHCGVLQIAIKSSLNIPQIVARREMQGCVSSEWTDMVAFRVACVALVSHVFAHWNCISNSHARFSPLSLPLAVMESGCAGVKRGADKTTIPRTFPTTLPAGMYYVLCDVVNDLMTRV